MKTFLSNKKMSVFLRSICFLFLFSSFLNTFVSPTQHLCHPDQRDALLKFKIEFLIQKPAIGYSDGFSYPKTRSWVNKSDCCFWDGITCDINSGEVIGLDLSSSDLHGELKSNSSLFRLRHLHDLNLAYNDFNNSPLPAEFDKLIGLERLNLSQSSLSGEIPSRLLQLTKLVSLDLSSNNFVGKIPSSIGNLEKLTHFNVGGNKLSGNLPATISNLTQIRSLYLYSNQFTGSLPPNISQLSKLETFDGVNSFFTGDILLTLLKIPSLKYIFLDYNQPDDLLGIENLSLLPNLIVIYINYNNYNKVGHVDLNLFSPLKKLQLLHLSGIPLSTTNVTFDSDFLSNLKELELQDCNILEFPEFIRNGRNLKFLDLSNNKIKGQLPDWLWRLPELSFVDLSSNAFQGPVLFMSSRSLQYLFLSKNNFTGEIPPSICGQSSLKILDLSDNNLYGSIPRCLETLMSSLYYLNLGNNSLNGSLPDIFMKAKNLGSLDISHNRLEGKLPASLTGCSALKFLNVGNNIINDTFPFQLNSLQKLQALGLRYNKFHGTLHNDDGVWCGFPQLKRIDVSRNDFLGTLPLDYFLNWTAMSSKRDNNMEPEYIENPRRYAYTHLDYTSFVLMSKGVSIEMERSFMITAIDFSENQLHGQIPDSIGLLKELSALNMSNNGFTGHIPTSLANLMNIESLDISQNKISGEIPQELGINVSHNRLVGSIPQDTQFQRQHCSSYEGNPGFSGSTLKDVCGDIKALRYLLILNLSRNKIEGQVPDWLWMLPGLSILDLSNNSLSGFNGSLKASPESNIWMVDLSFNAFQGPLFIPSRSLEYFWSSKNNFTGEIPRSICGLSSLKVLDLSDNNFHGSIPWCFKTLMSSLSDLNLRNNSLNGSLAEIFMNAKNLITFDVSHNRLEGKLPASLTSCSAMKVLNVGSNKINDTFPFQLSSLQKLQVLVLRSNKFHGTLHNTNGIWFGFPQLKIIDVSYNGFLGTLPSDYFLNWTAMSSKRDNNMEPEYIENPRFNAYTHGYYILLVLMSKGISMEMERILTIYTAIDFSGNQLHGKIPDSIGLLNELHSLNMSSNAFTGHIPSSLSNLTNLESLDISQNKISGEIPPELGTISSLAWINVSHKQLVGSIPQGTQFQRQNCSSYEGNPGLNSLSLKDVCGDMKALKPPQPELLNTQEEEESLSWIAACLGFAPGVVFGLAVGYNYEWFMKIFGRSKRLSTRTR